jgi:hypothetical protein
LRLLSRAVCIRDVLADRFGDIGVALVGFGGRFVRAGRALSRVRRALARCAA